MKQVKCIKIKGYGQIEELTLSEDYFRKQEEKETGKFLKIYPIKKSVGGNIIGSFLGSGNNLKGYMAEYEKVFIVIESDEEYIDVMFFEK